MNFSEIKEFLDIKFDEFNRPSFIESDPIQIPHKFSKKEDIEISAFLAAQIAWGKRSMIIRNAEKMMSVMQNSPYDFLMNSSQKDLEKISKIGHRTLMNEDFIYFVKSLKNIYEKHAGLENVFTQGYKKDNSIYSSINHFRNIFFELQPLERTKKHIANVENNSASKRINMFLMWLVRNDKRGVHFGLWKNIPTSDLKLPLDIHSGNTARALGILQRTQNDWKAVCEVTENLKKFDSADPVKYDFALFGLGVFENFSKIAGKV